MRYEVEIDGRARLIDVQRSDAGYTISVDGGAPRPVSAARLGPAEWRVVDGERQLSLGLAVVGDDVLLTHRGHAVRASVMDPRKKALELAAGGKAGAIRTEMPGAIVRVPVAVGATVRQGQVVVVVEAMKMENEFKAPFAGVVKAIHIAAGQAVEAGTTLLEIEKEA
jgi:biotin carboxyl carrier protein